MQLGFGLSPFKYLTRRCQGAATQLQLGHDVPAQGAKGSQLFRGQGARLSIYYAEGAQRVAVGRDQGRACVKPDVRFGRHEGIVGEAMVGMGVAHFEHLFGVQDRVSAEGHFARCLGRADADLGFEPLTLFVNQRDQGDGGLADGRGEQGEVIEGLFRRGVQYVVMTECFDPLRIIGRQVSFHEDWVLE